MAQLADRVGSAAVARHGRTAERRLAHRGEELFEVVRRIAPLAARGPVDRHDSLIRPLAQRGGADAEEIGGLADVQKPLACFHDPFPVRRSAAKRRKLARPGQGLVAGSGIGGNDDAPHCVSDAQVHSRQNLSTAFAQPMQTESEVATRSAWITPVARRARGAGSELARAARRSPRSAPSPARGRRRGRRPGGRRGSRRGGCARPPVRSVRSGPPSTSSRASEPQITTARRASGRAGRCGSGPRRARRRAAGRGARRGAGRAPAPACGPPRRRAASRSRAAARPRRGSRWRPGGGRRAASRSPSGRRARARPRRRAAARRARAPGAAARRPCARPSGRRGSPRARDRRPPRRSGRRPRPGAPSEAGPRPRRRATSTALEMLWVSRRAVAQRLDLVELVEAVVAGRARGRRVAEPPLPAAQRARADAEHLRGCVDPDPAHQVPPRRRITAGSRSFYKVLRAVAQLILHGGLGAGAGLLARPGSPAAFAA